MVYNSRLYEYQDGIQLRVYNQPIVCNKKVTKKLNKVITPKSSDVRTFEQEKHSTASSKNRTIQEIYEITRSNKWDWFLTFTFNPQVIDSSDYDLLSRKVSVWLDNTKRRHAPELKYVLVPELHKDGIKYHFHALLANIGNIKMTDSGKVSFNKRIYPYELKPYGTKIYNMPRWYFGWTTATKVINSARVSSYITKYITKELYSVTKNKKRYWHSRNCNKPKVNYMNIDYDALDYIISDNIDCIGNISSSKVSDAGLEIMYIEFNNKELLCNECIGISEQIQEPTE